MSDAEVVRADTKVRVTEPDYPVRMPRGVRRYVNWFLAAYGWNPFEGVVCSGCKTAVAWHSVYRCYDCKIAMCQACLVRHCGESRQYNSMANGMTTLDWDNPMVQREIARIAHPSNDGFRDEITRLQARIAELEENDRS